MFKLLKKLFVVLCLILFSLAGYAQDKQKITEEDYTNSSVEMADSFRKEGKIYVLTGIIVVILGGVLFYLVVLDKKIAKLEKQLDK